MSIRERKKQRALKNITSVARDLFLAKGYGGTTLEEVAELSDVGVGTVYNHYKSKADLFLAVMSDELNTPQGKKYPPSDQGEAPTPLEKVLQFIWEMASPLALASKELWRELMAVAVGSRTTDSRLLQGLLQLDHECIGKLAALLEGQKESGALPGDFESHQAAYVIYSVFMTQFMLYIFSPDVTLEDMQTAIDGQVRFVMRGI